MIHSNRHHDFCRPKLQRSCSQMRPQRQPPSRYGYTETRNPSETTSTPTSSELTLIVMGGEKVGKSALVSQFLWNVFPEYYRPTIEEFNWIEYDIGKNELLLQVIDTSGSRDFLAMRSLYAKTGDAFIVVFAVDDSESFLESKRIIQEIREENKKNAPILLIANKMDIMKAEVGGDEIDNFSSSMNLDYFSISAKNEDKVFEVFGNVLKKLKVNKIVGEHQMRKRRQSMPNRRAYSGIDLDVKEIERIVKKHHRKDNCAIS